MLTEWGHTGERARSCYLRRSIEGFKRILLAVALTWVALPVFAQEPGRVYVYAQTLTAARAWLPLSCDSTIVAKLKRGHFFAMQVPPGRHMLGLADGVPLFITIGPDDVSYVRLDWTMQIGRSPIPVLSSVQPAQARKEMAYLTYVPGDKIKARSVFRMDPRKESQKQLRKRDVPEN